MHTQTKDIYSQLTFQCIGARLISVHGRVNITINVISKQLYFHDNYKLLMRHLVKDGNVCAEGK